MQAVSPVGAIFGTLADNMAKQAEYKRRQKMLELQNNLALQRGLQLQNNASTNQAKLNRQNTIGQALIKEYGNPNLTPESQQPVANALNQFAQGQDVNIPEVQPNQVQKVPLSDQLAKFAGLSPGMQVPTKEAEYLANAYRQYQLGWARLKKNGQSERYLNINDKKVPAGDVFKLLSRYKQAMERNLEIGSPTGQPGANGKVNVVGFSPAIAADYLKKIDIIRNKIVLNEPLTKQEINFVENLKSPATISATNASQSMYLWEPNGPAAKSFGSSLQDEINRINALKFPK